MLGLWTFTHTHTHSHKGTHPRVHACMGPCQGPCILAGMLSNELLEEACPLYLVPLPELQTATPLSTHKVYIT